MCKRFFIVICCVLAVSVPARAATFTIVDLPAKGTDAAIGIGSGKVYTHAFDFGANAPATINGVALEQGPTANVREVYNGTSRQGYGYTFTDTRASIKLNVHAGSDASAQADGSSAELLRDMFYHTSSPANTGMVLTLSNLTPGTIYSTRFYYRNWASAPDPTRRIDIKADGESNGTFSDLTNVSLDAGGAHYLDYTFTADDTDVTFQFINPTTDNRGMHLYGLTNEIVLGPEYASCPSPPDGRTDVLRGTVLGWMPGISAAMHDVYLGTVLDDVKSASRINHPPGVVVSQGQDANTFDPGRLEFGKTYSWRVDEVNAPPSNTIYKGLVWKFEVEPYSIPVTNVEATASSQHDPNTGPEKTIDGSGLNADDQHSVLDKDMWFSTVGATQPTWIRYQFDRPYKLHQMLVWNANENMEANWGLGAKNVIVEHSMDANDGTALDPVVFAKATGTATYAGDPTPVLFGDQVARYVRLTIQDNWGGLLSQVGLSEVRFYAVPTRAREPVPTDDAAGVSVVTTLSWRSGREASTHRVYLGREPDNLTQIATVDQPSCEVELDLGASYYWQVVEVNAAEDPGTWEGEIWSFTTPDYEVVDDMEDYKNESFKEIWAAWLDGTEFGTKDPTNGSTVGADPAAGNYGPAAGRSGGQSLPIWFNNTGTASKSEAVRTFQFGDWTVHGVKSLSLWFFGDPGNTGQLYVAINNVRVLYDGDPTDLKRASWQPFNIDLSKIGATLQNVTKLTIGVEGAGAKGVIRIDDIRLYPRDRRLAMPVDPGATGLQVYYAFDGNVSDSSGKARHGTAVGVPMFVAGKVGQAISLDGFDEYVNADGYKGILADAGGVQQPFTIAAWVQTTASDDRTIASWGTNTNRARVDFRLAAGALRVEHGAGNVVGKTALNNGEWHHVVMTMVQGATASYPDVRFWLDGMDDTTASTDPDTFSITAGVDMAIGYRATAPARYFLGAIDEVRLYDRVLSLEEIAWLAGRTMPFDSPF